LIMHLKPMHAHSSVALYFVQTQQFYIKHNSEF